jgi:hypothetical protein
LTTLPGLYSNAGTGWIPAEKPNNYYSEAAAYFIISKLIGIRNNYRHVFKLINQTDRY